MNGEKNEFALQKDLIHARSKIKIIEQFVHILDKRSDVIENEQLHIKENIQKMESQLSANVGKLEIRFDKLDDSMKNISDTLSKKEGANYTRDKFWKAITAFMTIVATLGIADHFLRFISFVVK